MAPPPRLFNLRCDLKQGDLAGGVLQREIDDTVKQLVINPTDHIMRPIEHILKLINWHRLA
jgi:hypothetical protein